MSTEDKIRFVEALAQSGLNVKNLIVEFSGNMYNYENSPEREAEKGVSQITIDRALLRQTVTSVQKLFWGSSSHAVIFCCIRDYFGYPNNMSQYERDMADPLGTLSLDYQCTAGTLAMAFSNNRYLKLPVDKWKDCGVKSRVLRLVEEFKSQVEAHALPGADSAAGQNL